MLELIKDFQTLIAGGLALIGAGLVLIATRMQIHANQRQQQADQLAEVKSLAAILAVESEMSLRSAGHVAAFLYSEPRAPLDQDFYFQACKDNLSLLGKLPGDLPQQIMYCFHKIANLQELVSERAAALIRTPSTGDMTNDLKRTTVSTVDIASRAIVELAVLTPWLERVAQTGEALTVEQAMRENPPAFERVSDLARQLAGVKLQELQKSGTHESHRESADTADGSDDAYQAEGPSGSS